MYSFCFTALIFNLPSITVNFG